MKRTIITWLLFHANRYSKDRQFYEIKNRILSQYGKPVGYDLQEIDGKMCFHCDGSGKCKSWDWDCCGGDEEDYGCFRCGGDGWFKPPQRNVLLKMRIGRYTFHQPIQRLLEDEPCPYIVDSQIVGYVEKTPTRYGKLALNVLYRLYRTKATATPEQIEIPF